MSTEKSMPTGWAEAPLNDVCDINPRTGFESVLANHLVSFIPMAAVAEESGMVDLSDVRAFSAVSKGYTRFCDGDVLFAKITPCMENGKIAVARGLTNGVGCGTTEFHVLRSFDGIDADYVRYFLLQRSFRRDAERNMRGAAGQRRVPSTYLETRGLPVAPTNEQRRIVEKIEELFSDIEEGERALERARKLLDRYRQAVLKAAVSGELTKDWREKHKGEIESGDALLGSILKARRDAWEQAELAKMRAKGQEPMDDRWRERYPDPTPPDTTELQKLLNDWAWASLDQLVSGRPRSLQSGPFGSSLKHSEFQDTGCLVLGIDNVGVGRFLTGSQNRIRKEKFAELQRYQARPGDLLITVMASLGRSCVVPRDLEPAIVTKHLYRITLEEARVLPEYLNLVIQGCADLRRVMFKDARGQTRPGLNGEILRALPVPLPSTSEQQEIVAIVTATETSLDAQVREVERQKMGLQALRIAILTSAFSGKLVMQDPSDEPASVLLDRIRAERAAGEGLRKRKRVSRMPRSERGAIAAAEPPA